MKKFLLLLLFTAVFALAGLYYLGGFKEPDIRIETVSDFELYGLFYRGTPVDERLPELFRKMESLVMNSTGAKLHVWYKVEPAGKRDTLEVFVGMDQYPESEKLDTLSIQADQFMIAHIQANRWVMPGPEKIKAKIEAYADMHDETLQGIFIDKIIGEHEVEVIAPLKKN